MDRRYDDQKRHWDQQAIFDGRRSLPSGYGPRLCFCPGCNGRAAELDRLGRREAEIEKQFERDQRAAEDACHSAYPTPMTDDERLESWAKPVDDFLEKTRADEAGRHLLTTMGLDTPGRQVTAMRYYNEFMAGNKPQIRKLDARIRALGMKELVDNRGRIRTLAWAIGWDCSAMIDDLIQAKRRTESSG